jgi:uroporphyrinogen decarboxylase
MFEWKTGILTGNKRAAIPIMTHPGIEMIGATVREAASHGEIQFKAIRALVEKFPVAAATMMMDLSVEAEAFGAETHFKENDVPTISGRVVTDMDSARQLSIPDFEKGRLPQYLKAAELAAKEITDRPVLAGCIGPFSLAARLFGVTEIMMEMLLQPETIHLLLDKCSRFLSDYCLEFKKAGASGIIMAEPAAGMLSPALCREFSSNYVRQIVDATQDDRFIIILHNCGNTDPLFAEMQMTGAAGLHFGNKCNISAALQFLDKDILVMGNLDPVGVFKTSVPDEVSRKTRELLDITGDYPNFVVSSGCDIPPNTPLQNIAAFFDAID